MAYRHASLLINCAFNISHLIIFIHFIRTISFKFELLDCVPCMFFSAEMFHTAVDTAAF